MKEALKLALEELAVRFSEGWHEGIKIDASDIMLLNEAAQALAQPAQEPVAWMYQCAEDNSTVVLQRRTNWAESGTGLWIETPLYTTPQQRPWVGLTNEEASWCQAPSTIQTWKRIEAKLKEKNT